MFIFSSCLTILFGHDPEHGLWLTLASFKAGNPRITDLQLVLPQGTQTVANSYKNRLSLRLCINWPWPESMFLVLTERKASVRDQPVS